MTDRCHVAVGGMPLSSMNLGMHGSATLGDHHLVEQNYWVNGQQIEENESEHYAYETSSNEGVSQWKKLAMRLGVK